MKAIAEEDGHSVTTVDGSTWSRDDAESQSAQLDQVDGSKGEQQKLVSLVYMQTGIANLENSRLLLEMLERTETKSH